MKLCRFRHRSGDVRVGLVEPDGQIADLSAVGIARLSEILENSDADGLLRRTPTDRLERHRLVEVALCAPVENQEIWAAGVTYLRSRAARMEESDFSATAYDLVYTAARPELFFKSMPQKVVPPGETVGIRRDARWNVPEPELALVINSRGEIVGYTAGNDMTSRDIEGENLLYLPQAKIYERSCALGPWITLGVSEAEAREWGISLTIRRAGAVAFDGRTMVSQIKRSFGDLVEHLYRSQKFPHGTVLLTGTGIVPPDTFTLRKDDLVEIEISGIGRLENRVAEV